MMSVESANLGFPRIGAGRELKKATEAFWKGEIGEKALREVASGIRKNNWLRQKAAGISVIPSNDFSHYDAMLDTLCLVGAVPERFGTVEGAVGLDTYFSMARGRLEDSVTGNPAAEAMEMTKWFDANYHYIVPEFNPGQTFRLACEKPFEEFREALALGIRTRPVLIGPVTFLALGKTGKDGFSRWSLLDPLLEVYGQVLKKLDEAGVEWVQIDEPALVLDLCGDAEASFRKAYAFFSGINPRPKVCVATYFGGLEGNLPLAASLPAEGFHVDLVRSPGQAKEVLDAFRPDCVLSLGVIDGRNIWKTDLEGRIRELKEYLGPAAGRKVQIAPSCSLLHVPVDLENEEGLDEELKSWLAFAAQKLDEVSVVARALSEGEEALREILNDNRAAVESRKSSSRVLNGAVRERSGGIVPEDLRRKTPRDQRIRTQKKGLLLPLFPTTTIGSFPQTPELRKVRRQYKTGGMSLGRYEKHLQDLIRDAVHKQDELGLDVYVHGEFERNDMVEYFGEQLEGFAFTGNGWVQSYGTRCVKPPVIFGDISRPEPMTVDWFKFAQHYSRKPVKGMLTGPVTILQWSFVRDDLPRREVARQIALAVRDEVRDLEAAGAVIIQIDEAAFREGLPLRKAEWNDYLAWAVECFRLCSAGVKDQTQIHTHMCYSEFNDVVSAIAEMDADVISIESSRSKMELLNAFAEFEYPGDIGPGVYDIHSPRVPGREEIRGLLEKALKVFPREKLWVNPDCGLKTRSWEQVLPALSAMTRAAADLRSDARETAGQSQPAEEV